MEWFTSTIKMELNWKFDPNVTHKFIAVIAKSEEIYNYDNWIHMIDVVVPFIVTF